MNTATLEDPGDNGNIEIKMVSDTPSYMTKENITKFETNKVNKISS